MEKLKVGEVAILDDGREFICFDCLEEGGINYAYLISNFKPLEVKFVIQKQSNEGLELEVIKEKAKKEYLYKIFQEKSIRKTE